MDGKIKGFKTIVAGILILTTGIFFIAAYNYDYSRTGEKKMVEVTYKAKGGTFVEEEHVAKTEITKTVELGEKKKSAPQIEKEGYILKGWYPKKAKGKNTSIKKSSTLYAKWIPDDQSVFDASFDTSGE